MACLDPDETGVYKGSVKGQEISMLRLGDLTQDTSLTEKFPHIKKMALEVSDKAPCFLFYTLSAISPKENMSKEYNQLEIFRAGSMQVPRQEP